jgi:hypothetical protein
MASEISAFDMATREINSRPDEQTGSAHMRIFVDNANTASGGNQLPRHYCDKQIRQSSPLLIRRLGSGCLSYQAGSVRPNARRQPGSLPMLVAGLLGLLALRRRYGAIQKRRVVCRAPMGVETWDRLGAGFASGFALGNPVDTSSPAE